METGVHGQLMKLAARHVEMALNLALVSATIQHHQMAELIVLEAQQNPKHATQRRALPHQVGNCFMSNSKNLKHQNYLITLPIRQRCQYLILELFKFHIIFY